MRLIGVLLKPFYWVSIWRGLTVDDFFLRKCSKYFRNFGISCPTSELPSAHGSALTSNKKGRKKYYITSFLYWLKLHCCVRRRIAIWIWYTLKTHLVPLLKISQRWNLSEFPFTDPISVDLVYSKDTLSTTVDGSWNNPFICLGLGEKKAHRQIHKSQENQSWNLKFLNLDR